MDVRDTDPKLLARLLAVTAEDRVWRPEELGPILKHQLSVPVQFDLGSLDADLAAKLSSLAAAQGLLIRSFDDLLHHPHPPVELLTLTKQFAKAMVEHPESPLPREVGRLLYFASITVALIRCGQRISGLDNASLKAGLRWCLEQNWVDERTRALLKEGIDFLNLSLGMT